jgi:uracil phosphoribosyltransferase
MTHDLSLHNSLLSQFIAELRDVEIQKDSLRFRRNLERVGEIMAYEISRHLSYRERETITPLGLAVTKHLVSQPVIATILRAGLPLHAGMLNYFDKALNAFVSAYRKHHRDNSFEIALEYVACPDISGRVLIICDPMLATGSSMLLAYKALISRGVPMHTHIVTAIACVEGINYLKTHMPTANYTVWCGAVDEELTAHAFIVPGLGDAGDLAFGDKL